MARLHDYLVGEDDNFRSNYSFLFLNGNIMRIFTENNSRMDITLKLVTFDKYHSLYNYSFHMNKINCLKKLMKFCNLRDFVTVPILNTATIIIYELKIFSDEELWERIPINQRQYLNYYIKNKESQN